MKESVKKTGRGGARPGAGRPQVDPKEFKGRMQIRLDPVQRALVERGAHIKGQKLSTFIRESAMLCSMLLIEEQSPNVVFAALEKARQKRE